MRTERTSYDFVERTCCPVCYSADAETVYSNSFAQPPVSKIIQSHFHIDPAVLAGANYELVRCHRCELIYQKWIGDPILLGELCGSWVSQHCDPETDTLLLSELEYTLQSRDAHEILAVAACLNRSPSDLSTLDYGMGWALWSRIAKRLGCNSYGSDVAVERMEYARAHGVTPISDDQINAPAFHFINTEQVMEHVAQPREVAERLASAVLPGGFLKISVPSAENANSIVQALRQNRIQGQRSEVMPVFPLEHVNGYTKKSLAILANLLELEVVIPPLRARYAFLGHKGAISPFRPGKALKEIIRPVFQYHDPRNLYVWMRKPA